MTATEAARSIRNGSMTSAELVEACLDRIAQRDGAVHAWAWLDPAAAMAQARARDAAGPVGPAPLHGVPVAIKDVIDTADMPTAYGSAAYEGRRPDRDAACVAALRRAGAVIMGKSVTAEFATYRPGPTANPHDPAHTPGGSSSGSAAAVADLQVPLALGTQTAGSMVRPASFCGVLGFKPSFGRYSNDGVLDTAPRLDTLGIFARSVDDIALTDTVLAGARLESEPPVSTEPLTIGLYRSEHWQAVSPAMKAAFEQMAARLSDAGYALVERRPVGPFAELGEAQAILHRCEAWLCMGHIRRDHADIVSTEFRAFIDAGAAVGEAQYRRALAVQEACKAAEADLFDGADLLLSPGAPGSAPAGLHATGDPILNRHWTALGVPCLGFPGGQEGQLPLGLQWIGRTGSDRALLREAGELHARTGIGLRPPGNSVS